MLPSPNLALLTPADARHTIATAIESVLAGDTHIATLAQWALKAYHARVADADNDNDDDDDDDADELLPAAQEQLIIDALDALMFADDPTFALDTAALTSWRNRLRIAAV
jgi:hypothetical protein